MKTPALRSDLLLVAVLLSGSLYLGFPRLHPRATDTLEAVPSHHHPFPRYEPLRSYLEGVELAYYYQDPSWKLPRKAHHFQAQYTVAPTVLRFLYDLPTTAAKLGGRPVIFDFPRHVDFGAAIDPYVASLRTDGRTVETRELRPGLVIVRLREEKSGQVAQVTTPRSGLVMIRPKVRHP